MIAAATDRSLLRWRIATVALLFSGYAAYYFCRSNLSVAMPLILDELRRGGMDPGTATIRMGAVVSFGVLAYAAGKFLLAGVADFFGGRGNFLGGLAGAVVFTLLFAASGSIPLFTLTWIGNRFVQSAGWPGVVKIGSRWFSYSSYGAVMGILSISYLVGDAVGRALMGVLIGRGYGWRAIFLFTAAVAFVVLLFNWLFLKNSAEEAGFVPPEANPLNLFRRQEGGEKPRSVADLLGTLFRSPAFLIVCALSCGATLVRETFNTWTPTYFHQFAGLTESSSARQSALFPLVGAASVLLAGWLSDRLGPRGRALVTCAGLFLTALTLVALSVVPERSGVLSVVLLSSVALFLLGPYSYLAGAMAADFGGKQGAAASSGLIDGVGYIGGILAGDSMARISVAFGWQRAFLVLSVVSLVSSGAAALLFRVQKRGAAA